MKYLQYFLSSTLYLLKKRERLVPYRSRCGLHSITGGYYQQSRNSTYLPDVSVIPLPRSLERTNRKTVESGYHAKRLLSGSQTITEVSYECPPETDLLSYIISTLDELKGPNHCWLNTLGEKNNSLKKSGNCLVLAGRFLDSLLKGSHSPCMLERVKSLQQRFPQLYIMGFHCGSSVCASEDENHLVQVVMNEYITFPILLSDKTFPQVANACYILFKDSKDHVFYHEKDLDLETVNKAFEGLGAPLDESRLFHNMKITWVKQAETIKEPFFCSYLRNLLLYFPGCISADEHGDRLFLSDSNHHRIIVFSGDGKILDCIGSSPGFEDGDFESAKLVRPAASFYSAVEDCLYFVDSENHAIRKADMRRRSLETLYPTSNNDKINNSLWTRILSKLGLGKRVDTNADEFDSKSLMFPWYLMKSEDDSFFIINRSFETLWIMDLATGKIKEVIKGAPNILETCQQLIIGEVSVLKEMPVDRLPVQIDASCSLERIPYAVLMSSFTTLQNHTVICDTVGQRILKIDRESGVSSSIHFSNFGILGLPYWLSSPSERVYAVGCGLLGAPIDHFQCFSLLPGRIDIQLNVDIPVDTELVEPVQEGCIWRQARGTATEVSGVEAIAGSSEKVGVAQQWYDELDNLAFATTEPEMTGEDGTTMDNKFQDDRVLINCAVNTSPGTSEVIIYAALYLRLRRKPGLGEENQEKYAARIVDILNRESNERTGRVSCINFLLKSNRDLRDLVFVRPLHVRVKITSLPHPKADSTKGVLLTDSSIEVNVSLDS